MLTPSLGQQDFERHLFDWQITPFAAVLDYLERDFVGVFEREDLQVVEGEVEHRRLLTRHPHDFHAENGALDERDIDRQYRAAREKFDHLAAKFRRLTSRRGQFLYVVRATPGLEQAIRLRRLLQAAPGHQFELLFLGWEADARPPDLEGIAHFARAPLESDKSAGREWEGNDPAWDEALRPWPLASRSPPSMDR